MTAGAELDDIQALVRSGLGSLGSVRYLLLRVGEPHAAKAWLGRTAPARASEVGGGKTVDRAIQLAFTRAGLAALGLGDADLEGLAPEFLDGMTGDERRSHRLGDVGASAPAHWAWGVGTAEPHLLVMLFARSALFERWADGIEADALAAGFTRVAAFDSCPAREDGSVAQEPFGFADGMSQPDIDWDGRLAVTGAANRDYRPGIAAGEVLIGHPNEYGFVADMPERRLSARNGSYLVYRQLAQDVTGFWRWAAAEAGPARAVWLAERIVGRCLDGAALPGLGAKGNDFLFKRDPDGLACPLAAHIRRANPRSGDDPLGRRDVLRDIIASLGLEGRAEDDAVASARFHRLLRRGRPYGTMLSPDQAMDPAQPPVEAGLHFVCLNASLARQFEFVQGAWIASATFGGLNGEGDPLIGQRQPFPDERRTDLFRYHDEAGVPRIANGLPPFVTVRGGAYFLLPGLAGLGDIIAA